MLEPNRAAVVASIPPSSSLVEPKPLDAATDLPPDLVYRPEAEQARVFFKGCIDHLGALNPTQRRYKDSVQRLLSSQKIGSPFNPLNVNYAWTSEFGPGKNADLESILFVALYFPKMYHYFDALLMRVMAEHVKSIERKPSPEFHCDDLDLSTDSGIEADSDASFELVISEKLLPDFAKKQIPSIRQVVTFLLRHCTGRKLDPKINYLEIYLADTLGEAFSNKMPLTEKTTLADDRLIFLSSLLRYSSESTFNYVSFLFLFLLAKHATELNAHLAIVAAFNQQYEANHVQEVFGDAARLARLRVFGFHLMYSGRIPEARVKEVQNSYVLFTSEYRALFARPGLTSRLSETAITRLHHDVFKDLNSDDLVIAQQEIAQLLPS